MTATRSVLMGSPSGVQDPYFTSVVQLAHFDGTNGSTTFTNSCPRGNTIAASGGSVSLSTAHFKWGTASLLCPGSDGSGDGGSASSNTDYAFGTNDWTIEFWAYPLALANPYVWIDFRNTSLTAAWAPTLGSLNSSGAIHFYANGADRITTSNSVYAINTWQHIALCRATGNTRLFVNGTQVGSTFSDSNTYVQNGFHLLSASNTAGSAHGYMDDLRITNGVGRYAANFSPPTAAFPNQ